MCSVEILFLGRAGLLFEIYDTELRVHVRQVTADIGGTDNLKSVFPLRRDIVPHFDDVVGIGVNFNDIVRGCSCRCDRGICDHIVLLCVDGSIRCFRFPCAPPDAAAAALAGVTLLTFVGGDAAAA